MPEEYVPNQMPVRFTVREKVAELTYNTKWFAPLFFVLCFAVFGAIGLIWVLLVNTPIHQWEIYPCIAVLRLCWMNVGIQLLD